MKLSVEQAIAERPVSPTEAATIGLWVNRQLIPLIKEIRAVLNMRGVEKASVTTTALGAYARLWTSVALPTDCTWSVEAYVVGTGPASGSQHASYVLTAGFSSTAGTVAQIGATTTTATESDAAIDARFAVDAPNRQIYLEARDDGVALMSFAAVLATTEVAV